MYVVCAQSSPILCDRMEYIPPRLLCSWNFPGKNTRVGCHFLLQGIFLTKGSYLHLWWFSGKESACQCRRCKRHGFDPWVRKIPWSRKWQSTLIFLPGKFHEQRSLEGYTPWGCKESDTTEWLNNKMCALKIINKVRTEKNEQRHKL